MDAEQSLLKLDAYCHFRQMAAAYEPRESSYFLENVIELTSEALASFKLAFDRSDICPLKICSNILNNIISYIKHSPLSEKFRDLFVVVEEAYANVAGLLKHDDKDLVDILSQGEGASA